MLFEKILENFIAEEDARQYDENAQQFRVSMLYGCERKQIYNALKFSKKTTSDGHSMFTLYVGTAIHELIQTKLMEFGLIKPMWKNGKPDEISILRKDLRLSAHTDGILLDGETLFEFKTIAHLGFNFIVFNNKAKKDHVHQINTYLGLLGLKKAIILYFNKSGMVSSDA